MDIMKYDVQLLDYDTRFTLWQLASRDTSIVCRKPILRMHWIVLKISVLLFGLTRRKERIPAPPMIDDLPLI
jgi:hypothetical protein